MNVAYNMDCMEAMKQMPDNAYDLAVVDPPYGDGLADNGGCKGWFTKYHQDSSQVVQVERERESNTERGTGSDNDLTVTNTRLAKVNRGGWHGKQKYYLGEQTSRQRSSEGSTSTELVELGRRSTQKNHIVGCCAGAGIFRGTVSHLT